MRPKSESPDAADASAFQRLSRLFRLASIRTEVPANQSLDAPLEQTDDQNPKSNRTIWQILWPMARPYRRMLILGLVLNSIHGIAISFQTLLPTYLIDHVVMDKQSTKHQLIVKMAWLLGGYLLSTIFMRMIMWHLSYRIFTRVRELVVFDLRSSFFRHVNHLCLRFHNRYASGELFNFLFGSPLGQMQAYFNHVTLFVPGAIFSLIWTLTWVSTWDLLMSCILIFSVILTVVQIKTAQSNIRKIWEEYHLVENRISGHVSDLIRGARHVKLYGIEGQVIEDFDMRATQIRHQVYQRDIRSHIQNMKQEGLGYICFALLCGVGTWRYFQGVLTVGQLQGYFSSFFALQWPMQILFQMATLQSAAQSAIGRIDAVMQTPSSTPDPQIESGQSVQIPPQNSEIVMDHVTFGYNKNNPVLKDISLTIPYGQHVALVGSSGGGKSTLSQLLMRLYDPDQGSIKLSGVDLRNCFGTDLRKRFGVVPQDPFIFRTTLRENLRVVRPDATEEQLQTALRNANALAFVQETEKGLDTPVGEGGSTLSGGQRQRLAIARALLADPDFFILDEATSALDSHSEQLIQQSIETAMKGRTALIIAHRLATVKNCDRILVLHGGAIAQDGTYDQLVEQPGLFRELVVAQQLRS